MNEWAGGYRTDVAYTVGYYGEMNPTRARFGFLAAGLHFPEVRTACELGFGQGLSINVHAAAGGCEWFGTDIMPDQAAKGLDMAKASGAPIRIYDQAFQEFCNRTDLPDFDFIALHGVWTWVSDDNRRILSDFLRRKLKVGGVAYISYNTTPGSAFMLPIRDLLQAHEQTMSPASINIIERINQAVGFVDGVLRNNAAYSQAYPVSLSRFGRIKDLDRSYVAHEYFNRDWAPMSTFQLAEWLQPTKLTYATSANYLDPANNGVLSIDQKKILESIPDHVFRETVRDVMICQSFRKDYWVRGARPLNGFERVEVLRSQRFILARSRRDVSLKIDTPVGEVTLMEQIYSPILDCLSDCAPRTFAEIESVVVGKGVDFARLLEALLMLVGLNAVACVQDDEAIAKARPFTTRLNAWLNRQALGAPDANYLVSPVTGGAIAVDRVQQLFLVARAAGRQRTTEWAEFVWNLFVQQGQRVAKDGKMLEAPADNLAELKRDADAFASAKLPVLQALGICS